MENRDDVNKWGVGGNDQKEIQTIQRKEKKIFNTYKYYPQIKVKMLHLLYKKETIKIKTDTSTNKKDHLETKIMMCQLKFKRTVE